VSDTKTTLKRCAATSGSVRGPHAADDCRPPSYSSASSPTSSGITLPQQPLIQPLTLWISSLRLPTNTWTMMRASCSLPLKVVGARITACARKGFSIFDISGFQLGFGKTQDTSSPVPKCLGSELSWKKTIFLSYKQVQIVLYGKFNRFHTMSHCDAQMDGRTDGRTLCRARASQSNLDCSNYFINACIVCSCVQLFNSTK